MISHAVDIENYAYSLFGLIAIQENLITHEQLLEALSIQRKEQEKKIGTILNEKKYLAIQDMFKVLKIQGEIHRKSIHDWTNIPDSILKGLVYFSEKPILPTLGLRNVLIAQKIQKNYQHKKTLTAILLEDMGIFSEKDIKEACKKISFSASACPNCLRIFLLYNYNYNVIISCPVCLDIELSLDFESWKKQCNEEQLNDIKFAHIFKKKQQIIHYVPQIKTSKKIHNKTRKTSPNSSSELPLTARKTNISFLEMLENENAKEVLDPEKPKNIHSHNATQIRNSSNANVSKIVKIQQVPLKPLRVSRPKTTFNGNETRIRKKEELPSPAKIEKPLHIENILPKIPCFAEEMPITKTKHKIVNDCGAIPVNKKDTVALQPQKIVSNPAFQELYQRIENNIQKRIDKKEKVEKKFRNTKENSIFSVKKKLYSNRFVHFAIAISLAILSVLCFLLFYGLEIPKELVEENKKLEFCTLTKFSKISLENHENAFSKEIIQDPAENLVHNIIKKLHKIPDKIKMNRFLKEIYTQKQHFQNSGDYWNLLGRMYLYKIFLDCKENKLLEERKEKLKREALEALNMAKKNYETNQYKSTFKLTITDWMPENYLNSAYDSKNEVIEYKTNADSISDIQRIISDIENICSIH